MLNEKVIRIPKCSKDTDLCPLEKFAKIFKASIHDCKYDEWCKHEEYESKYAEYLRLAKESKDESSSSPVEGAEGTKKKETSE